MQVATNPPPKFSSHFPGKMLLMDPTLSHDMTLANKQGTMDKISGLCILSVFSNAKVAWSKNIFGGHHTPTPCLWLCGQGFQVLPLHCPPSTFPDSPDAKGKDHLCGYHYVAMMGDLGKELREHFGKRKFAHHQGSGPPACLQGDHCCPPPP